MSITVRVDVNRKVVKRMLSSIHYYRKRALWSLVILASTYLALSLVTFTYYALSNPTVEVLLISLAFLTVGFVLCWTVKAIDKGVIYH